MKSSIIGSCREGWLGKPHALALGVARARAPWLLFTDGDVTFAPQALELALTRGYESRREPFRPRANTDARRRAGSRSAGLDQALGQWAARMWKVQDPNAKDFFGVGGFNLLRADALEAFGGMERLRMEIVEDVSLGWLSEEGIHRKSMMVLGPGLVKNRVDAGTIWNREPARKECLRRISLQCLDSRSLPPWLLVLQAIVRCWRLPQDRGE